MKYIAIFAMDEDRVIGINNTLPWNIPDDLRRFSTITRNSIVVMGRKTLDSLPNGQPLRGRINVVLTREPHKYTSTEKLIYTDYQSVSDVLAHLNPRDAKKVFIIGGEEVFSLFLPQIHTIYLTMVYHPLLAPFASVSASTSAVVRFPLCLEEIKRKYLCIHCSAVNETINENYTYQFYTFVHNPLLENKNGEKDRN